MSDSVAIVHDWLTSMRGGERVVEALYGVFPQADLFTLTWDPARLSPSLRDRRATTSAIHRVAHAPFMSGRFRGLLPLFPRAVESFNLDRYSLVVSSSHCVALGARAAPSALHVAYLHSTMRYTREGQPTYEASVPGGHLGRAVFRSTAHYLRRWELEASSRPHVLIANSSYTRDRIRRYYQRDAQIIEPPIETRRFEQAARPDDATTTGRDAPFLVVSALVPNKRVDLAMRAFEGRPERLIVVGDGPERGRLEALTRPNVTLRSRVDEAELTKLFTSCRALLHPGIDDFGMVMVEALAAGRPVLACAEGGALDIVEDGETGLLIDGSTVEAVRAALDRFARRTTPFDAAKLRESARRFDRSHFERRFAAAVDDARGLHRPALLKKEPNGAVNGQNGHGHGQNGHGNGQNGHANGLRNGQVNGHAPASAVVAATRHRLPLYAAPPPDPPRAAASLDPTPAPITAHAADSAVKRAFDVAFATSGLLLCAPLMGACAAAIALDSPGTALFFQRRVGQDQRPFTMVKLRTMDADGQVTPVGQWLRPLGLDELPQLWNVLQGTMSVIGPRPEVPSRVERYRTELPGYDLRHRVRPGITGLAQVRGLRGDHSGSIADRLSFDLEYVRKWSLSMDLGIALRTVPRVLGDTFRALRGS